MEKLSQIGRWCGHGAITQAYCSNNNLHNIRSSYEDNKCFLRAELINTIYE